MHPFAINVFSKEIKRVYVIDSEIKIHQPDDMQGTGIFVNEIDYSSPDLEGKIFSYHFFFGLTPSFWRIL
jgi:hypothetical protein